MKKFLPLLTFIALPLTLCACNTDNEKATVNFEGYSNNIENFQKDFNEYSLNSDKQFNKLKENVNLVRNITTEQKEITDPELKSIYQAFVDAMSEDFNTPLAMVELNKINKIIPQSLNDHEKLMEINKFITDLAESVLGLDFGEVTKVEPKEEISAEVKELASKRWEAKLNKNWAEADKLRDQLKTMGYVINDRKDGYDIEKI